MARDYYEVLGVSRSASDKEVRQAYRRLARKYHPDVNQGDKRNEGRFKEVNAAYEVLSDPANRKKYDAYGDNWRHADKFQQAGGPFTRRTTSPGGSPFDLGDAGLGGLGDIFGDLFGASRRQSGARTASWSIPAEVPVELTLEEAYTGTTRTVQMPPMPGVQPKRLEVRIPPGVDAGSKVHVPAAGMDLYLVVNVAPHHRFVRKGADLHQDISVPLADALLGSEQNVQTLKGKVALAVPPESQNGQVFRLRGLGMPNLSNPEARGDLFVTLKVILPANLSDRERQFFQEMQRARGRTGVS